MNNNIGLFSILKLKTPLSFYFLAVKSRWQVPSEQPYFSASTANDLRRDKYPVSPDPEKLKALMRGYSQSDSLFSFIVFFYFYCWYLVVNSPFFCWALFFFPRFSSWEGICCCYTHGLWRSDSLVCLHCS